MRNRRAFISLLTLLSMSLVFSTAAYTKSGKNSEKESLFIEFASKNSGEDDPGTLYGKVTNRSSHAYPCVRLEFVLATRFEQQTTGDDTGVLGTLSVEVRNIAPNSTVEYEKPMPYLASIGFKSKGECSTQPPGTNPDGSQATPRARRL